MPLEKIPQALKIWDLDGDGIVSQSDMQAAVIQAGLATLGTPASMPACLCLHSQCLTAYTARKADQACMLIGCCPLDLHNTGLGTMWVFLRPTHGVGLASLLVPHPCPSLLHGLTAHALVKP